MDLHNFEFLFCFNSRLWLKKSRPRNGLLAFFVLHNWSILLGYYFLIYTEWSSFFLLLWEYVMTISRFGTFDLLRQVCANNIYSCGFRFCDFFFLKKHSDQYLFILMINIWSKYTSILWYEFLFVSCINIEW
jgi:hypothetical protein